MACPEPRIPGIRTGTAGALPAVTPAVLQGETAHQTASRTLLVKILHLVELKKDSSLCASQ
jgi:hypothetical protein